MPEARSAKNDQRCHACGASLAGEVCPACALDFLSTPAQIPTVRSKDGGTALDIQFGNYRLKRRLASGGMGVVYIAEHRDLKREVALKMIRGSSFASDSERARFMLEAEAAATLEHRNIVPIYEIGVEEEQPFFTMRLIRGVSLAELLRREPKPGLRDLARWIAEIARAVQHAHAHGVLHRDLKPGNVLIDERGKPWLMDFGLAKLAHADSGLTRTSDSLGTPNYMAPEVIDGKAADVSTAGDVWALGVMLWEALCGRPPFTGSGAAETMRKIVAEEPPPPDSTVDIDLLTLARRCLEKDPSRRVATAGEVARELDRWGRGEPLLVRRITAAERALKWARRKPALAALYLTLAVASVSSLILWQRAESAVETLTHSNDQLEQALAISTATKLAMQARVQVNEDPARGLLLAVEAIEQTESLNGGVLPEAIESLHATLQQVGGRNASPSSEPVPIQAFVNYGPTQTLPPLFSPDGRLLLTLDYSKSTQRGTWAAISPVGPSSAGAAETVWQVCPGIDVVSAVAWLADSSGFVILDPDGELRHWDLSGEPEGTSLGNLNRAGMRLHRIRLMSKAGSAIGGVAVYLAQHTDGLFLGRFVAPTGTGGGLPAFSPERLPVPGAQDGTPFDLSPGGRWFAAWTAGKLWLLDLEKRESAEFAPPLDRIAKFEFSADERRLAFVSGNHSVWDCDLGSDSAARAVATCRKMKSLEDWIQIMEYSPDCETLAVASHSEEVHLIPTTGDGKAIRSLRLNQSRFLGIGFSPDGRWIAGGSFDNTVSIWPTEWDGATPAPDELRGLPTQALDVTFSPGSDSLVATGMNPAYWLWDLSGSKASAQPEVLGHAIDPGMISDMAVSPGREWYALACEHNGKVKILDAGGTVEWVIGKHLTGATGVAFDPSGRWLASGGKDGTIKVWDLPAVATAISAGASPPPPLHVLDVSDKRTEYPRRLAFHPRGILYATCGDGVLFEWDLNRDSPIPARKDHHIHSGRFLLPDVQVSPDARLLAVARHGNDATPFPGATQYGNMVLLFDVSSPGPPVQIAELPATFKVRTNVEFSPDNRWLAAGSDGGAANVWDLHAANLIASRRTAPVVCNGVMQGIAFSPDGQTLALGDWDGRIHLWDWRATRRPTILSTGRPITSLSWIDRTRLASAGASGRVEIWETEIARLKRIARSVAGRELDIEERRRFRVR